MLGRRGGPVLRVWVVDKDEARLARACTTLQTLPGVELTGAFLHATEVRRAFAAGATFDVALVGNDPSFFGALAAGTAADPCPPPSRPATVPLTPREAEVLGLLCTGASYRDVARDLGISEGTVQSHVKRLYEKLGVCSKAEAVRMAYEGALLAGRTYQVP